MEVTHCKYAGGDGFTVYIVKAPKEAKTKADVIALGTVKKKSRKILVSTVDYYTPDEAMAVAMGLLKAVDYVMSPYFQEFRKKKDKHSET